MPNTVRDDSTVPAQEKVVNQDGLVSRSYWNFLSWVKRSILRLQQGPQQVPQASLVLTSANLGNANTGLLIFVSDFNHTLQWDGTAWGWAPNEAGGGFYVDFDALTPPTGVGWHLCDGSTVDCLQADGSVISVTLPTTANRYFRQ